MASVGFLNPARCLYGHGSSRRLNQPPETRFLFSLGCSAEASPEASVADGEEVPPSTEKPLETTKKTPSLISAANVRKALRGIEITNVDHYGRLGIAKGDSYNQVEVAFQKKCKELMSQELDEEEANKQLDLLKESYAILSSEEERRLYDWSFGRSESPDRYVWPFEVDITQTPTQSPPPQAPEDVEPTRLVGYFFLAWFLLSVVASVTLNR
uniref:J domain-containing protein n=1 Tax=Apostasia odorata TaxID=280455 RepID=A0A1S6YFW2_9ASPA|nr:hypothetical protein [Apostasia odorata]